MGGLRQRFTPRQLTGWLAFLAGIVPAPDAVSLPELLSLFQWEKVPCADIILKNPPSML